MKDKSAKRDQDKKRIIGRISDRLSLKSCKELVNRLVPKLDLKMSNKTGETFGEDLTSTERTLK